MKKVCTILVIMFLLSLFCTCALAAEGRAQLPTPARSGGMALMGALSARQSARDFADVDLTPQQLSDLLWAAAGVNRTDGRKTYPVALGRQDMTVYVFNRNGVYLYHPEPNEMELVVAGDHRGDAGKQPFAAQAAVNLAYVQDLSLWQDSPETAKAGADFGFAHTGAMMQNAYLYAASQGWSAVVRGSFDQEPLAKLMKLTDKQVIKLIQSVGPK